MMSVTRVTCASITASRRTTSSVCARGGMSRRSSSRWPATECSGVPTSWATSAMMRPESASRSAWPSRR